MAHKACVTGETTSDDDEDKMHLLCIEEDSGVELNVALDHCVARPSETDELLRCVEGCSLTDQKIWNQQEGKTLAGKRAQEERSGTYADRSTYS